MSTRTSKPLLSYRFHVNPPSGMKSPDVPVKNGLYWSSGNPQTTAALHTALSEAGVTYDYQNIPDGSEYGIDCITINDQRGAIAAAGGKFPGSLHADIRHTKSLKTDSEPSPAGRGNR